MSEMKEAYQAYLISPCAVGDELPIAFEAGYLAGQASVEERVKELEQERDEAVRQWERFERMAGDNWAALKAQAGEPVAWQHRQRGLKEYEWQEWQTVGYKPQGPESQTFQMRPLFTHPTTERPYNPLNDYAVIPMNPTEPVKAQAGEPVTENTSDGYHTFKELYECRHALFVALLRSNPSISWRANNNDDGTQYEGWFVAGMHLPSGDISFHLPVSYWELLDGCLIATTNCAPPFDGHNTTDVIKRLLTPIHPTTERRVMEMALEALESVEPKFTEHHEAIEALRNALNAAPAKGEV